MPLSKQALVVKNNTNFPNNNTGYITPALLREFNTDMIDAMQLTQSMSEYAVLSGSNTFIGNQTITGDLNVSGVISASILHVQTETASVIYSSGSNQFGDELTDIQTLSGSVKIEGQLLINGIPLSSGSAAVDTGSLVTTASFNAYTQSTDLRLNSLETNSASVNVSIANINTTTASLSNSITNINSFTQSQAALNGTFATTGSNTFTGNQVIDRAYKLFTNGVYWTDMTAGFNNLEIINQGGGNLDFASLNGGRMRVVNTPLQLTGSTLSSNSDISTSANVYGANLTASAIPAGTISSSAQISALGFVSSSVTASSLITASLSGQTLTFTKGDNSTFGIILPDVSGSDITALNQFTASQLLINTGYNTFTSSTNTSISSLNQFSASALVSISNINSTTASLNSSVSQLNVSSASQQISIDNLNAATSSYITESETASFARTNVDNNFTANQTFTNITAVSASFTYVQTLYETASVIYSSGSNQFGDELTDVQILSGSVEVEGSLTVNGIPVLTSSVDISGLVTTASFNAYTQSNDDKVNSLINATGSYATTGSNTFVGEQRIFNNQLLRFTNNGTFSGDSGSRLSVDAFTGMQFRNFSNNDMLFEQFGTASLGFYNYNGGIALTGSSTTIQGVNFIPFSASLDARILAATINTGSFATTGSNSFNGSQIITGSITTTQDITISGVKFGFGNPAGTSSIAIGNNALANNTGNANVAIGNGVLQQNTTGIQNMAFGFDSLQQNTIGDGNTAIGTAAGRDNQTGNENVFIGWISAYNAGDVSQNTIIGARAATAVKSNNNTIIGHQAANQITSGSSNTIIGQNAATNISSGSSNTIIGQAAGAEVRGGSGNTFIGHTSGYNTSGSNNTFIGPYQGKGDESGVIVLSDGAQNLRAIYNSGWVFTGSVDIQNTLTASLQQGYVWVGDSTGRTTLVATSSFGGGGTIDTASFATTGSNTFRGDQTVSGSVNIINFANGEVDTLKMLPYLSSSTFNGNRDTILTARQAITIDGINYQLAPTSPVNIILGATNPAVSASSLVSGSNNIISNGTNFNTNAANIEANNSYISVFPSTRIPAYAPVRFTNSNVNAAITAINNTNGLSASFAAGFAGYSSFAGQAAVSVNASGIFSGMVINPNSSSISLAQSVNAGNLTITGNKLNPNISASSFTIANTLNLGTTTLIDLASGSYSSGNTSFARNLYGGVVTATNISASTTFGNLQNTIIFGSNLIVTGSDGTVVGNGGSAFFGRFNINDGITNRTSNTVFAVGAGTAVGANARTPLWVGVDASVNVTGSLRVSGSLIVNGIDIVSGSGGSINTGSFATTGSNSFNGNQTISGSLRVSGSTTLEGTTTFIDRNGSSNNNIYLGDNSFGSAIGNTFSIAMGVQSMRFASGSTENIALGSNSLLRTTGSKNTAIGSNAMENNTTGNENLAIGINALNKNTTANFNTAIGNNALQFNTTGGNNFALGQVALNQNTTGTQNVAIGVGALFNNTTGVKNIAIGNDAGINASGSNNTYIGDEAGGNITGSNNVIIGRFSGTSGQVLDNNIILSDGQKNVRAQYSGSWELKSDTSVSGSLTVQSGSSFFANGNKQFNVGAFSSLVTQSGSAGVSQSVNFEVTDKSEGVSIASNNRITLANSGTYSITFSAQIKADGGQDTIWMWLKKNGTNVANTSTKIIGKNGEETVLTVNYVVDAAASDYYELAWENLNGYGDLLYEPSSGNYPAIPSVILTVTQVR
jgi:hypothetical protein